MIYLRSFLVLLCLFLTHVAQAEIATANKQGKLEVTILASDNPDFIKNWLGAAFDKVPYVKLTHMAKPDHRVVVAFLGSGLTLGSDGRYDASISWQWRQPDGKIMFGEQNYSKLKGTAPQKYTKTLDSFAMADPALDLIPEATDPKGAYRLEVEITDNLSMRKANSVYIINVQ